MIPNVPHYVYRCYDAAGRLLYVGCTFHVKSRLAAHRHGSGAAKASRWLQVTMAAYEVEGPYPTKEAGLAAEAAAIRTEQPLFNRQGQQKAGWQILPRVADYLIENGYRALAKETACTCWGEFRDIGEIDPDCVAHSDERRELSELELEVIFS